MLVFIVDKNNRIGHPTSKNGYVRRKLKQGKAKVIRRFQDTIVVKIFDLEIDKKKTIMCKYILGIDPGYKHIGYYVVKVIGNKIYDILSGEVVTRTSEVTDLLKERKMFRQNRRRNNRLNVKRKFGKAKFKHPIWKNRKKHAFQPTHIHLMQSHLNLIKKICSIVQVDSVCIEYFKFDSQKVLNPNISGTQYQQGRQKDFENVKAYVRDRDDYSCQVCKEKDTMLHVHHVVERSRGGSDRPDNLITVCASCHDKIHTGKVLCPSIKNNTKFRDSGVLNSCMPKLFNVLKASKFTVSKTYGSYTKYLRNRFGFKKGHREDAFCVALSQLNIIDLDGSKPGNEINFRQFRRHNRSWTNQIEDRKYYFIDSSGKKKLVAKNRNRREGQSKKTDICLTEFRQLCKKKGVNIQLVSKSRGRVKKNSLKIFPDKKLNWQFRMGNQYIIDGNIRTITGTGYSQQRIYYSKTDFDTFTQIRNRGDHLKLNEGLVSI